MLNANTYTRFLPPERLTQKIIEKSYKEILSLENLNEILNTLSSLILILNSQRQIIFANTKIQETLGFDNIKQILGQRPGEMLSCLYSDKNPCGCGTTEECTVCGAASAIKQSMETSTSVQKECRIITKSNDTHTAYDFQVTATPLKIKSSHFTVLSFIDISDKKRREWLESIFYHDIINIAGSISGLVELIEIANDEQKKKKYVKMASVVAKNLIDEIISQRSLNAAENGNLDVDFEKKGSLDILNEVKSMLEGAPIARNRKISIDSTSSNISFTTDPALLKRILVNLLKNALEAAPENGAVTMACAKTDDKIEFSVHNPGKIPEDVQLQMFQRSFSTKGNSRGMGTYSVKLLTERFLNGTVSFTSEEKRGTTFKTVFPIHVNPVKK
jgi:K+-sensing histidine kinase KdpD